MAEKKTEKKSTKAAKTTKAAAKKTKKVSFEGMSIKEARLALQKLVLHVRTREESDTSKVQKLRKYIARTLTKQNLDTNSK